MILAFFSIKRFLCYNISYLKKEYLRKLNLMTKKIGILTSGGDCGGLNAAIRSIFYRAKNKYNMDVFGIKDGTAGLMQRPVAAVQLTHKTFGGYLLRQGGTFLGSTNKGNPFKFPSNDGKYMIDQKR